MKKKTKFIVNAFGHGSNLYGICNDEIENYLEVHGYPLAFTREEDAQRVCDALNKCKCLITTLAEDIVIKEAENGDKVEYHGVV